MTGLRQMELDLMKDWNELNDTEKLSWTIECNVQKEKEVRAFAKKSKIDFESCKDQLEYVNPMQRWYEARGKEIRRQKKEAKR